MLPQPLSVPKGEPERLEVFDLTRRSVRRPSRRSVGRGTLVQSMCTFGTQPEQRFHALLSKGASEMELALG